MATNKPAPVEKNEIEIPVEISGESALDVAAPVSISPEGLGGMSAPSNFSAVPNQPIPAPE